MADTSGFGRKVSSMMLVIMLFWTLFGVSTSSSQLSFSSDYYQVNVSENTKIGQSILQLSVLDTQSSSNFFIFHLANLPEGNSSSSNNDFYLTPNGTLQISRPLNRKRIPSYTLTVSVSDTLATFTQLTFTRVFVQVLPFPGNYPVFSIQSNHRICLPVNSTIGEPFYTIQATTSGDDAPIYYELIGERPAYYQYLFRLDKQSGQLSLQTSLLSYEYQSNYRLVVRASSSIDSSVSSDIVINVCVPRPTVRSFTLDSYALYVPRDYSLGSVFGYVFLSGCNVSRDGDDTSFGTGVTFSVSGSHHLSINPTTGGLSLISSLSAGSANALVSATVAGGGASRARVTVSHSSFESVNLTQRNYVIEIGDDIGSGSVIGEIDGGEWNQYKLLSGDCQGIFIINETSGQLSIRYTPSLGTYYLTVGVICNRIIAPVWVQVRVRNVNTPPLFDREIYQITVFSNTSIGQTIAQLVINDTDTNLNGTFLLTPSPHLPSSLTLTQEGTLIVKESLQGYTSFNFSVTAQDKGTPPLSSTATVIVTIITVTPPTPLAPPTFERTQYEGSVYENDLPGTVVLSVSIQSTSTLVYWLTGPQSSLSHLSITPTGHILVRSPIDRERHPSLTVQVHAKYALSTNNDYSSSTVHITVLDRIDTTPVFITPNNHTLYLTTPIAPLYNILTVQAITQDNTSTVRYSLTSTNSSLPFVLDSSTGIISTTNSPISSTGVYELDINATVGSLSSSISINVVVMDTSPAPELHPTTLYLSTFNYLLPSLFRLANLSSSNGGRLILGPSPCDAHLYFQLNGSGLYVVNTIRSGEYNLNVSLAGPNEGVWFERNLKVRVNLLTNTTLDHTLFLVLPNLSREHFLEHFISSFQSSIISILNCQYDCLDIVTVQTSGRGLKVGVAVKKPDLVSYYSVDTLRSLLVPYEDKISSQWTVFVDDDGCGQVNCEGYKECRPSLTLYLPHSPLTSSLPSSSSLISLSSLTTHTCTCPSAGYDDTCTNELDECRNNPCLYGAKCIDLLNDYFCDCPNYSSGKNCSAVCPAPSTCKLCSPNPCLNGGTCTIQGGQRVCDHCPAGYSGDLCELTTAHFEGGSGYVSLPSLERRKKMELSFDFVGVQPNTLLLYTGQFNGGNDYIQIDLLFGLLRVSVGWGNWSTSRTISSDKGLLNDGQWHTVNMALNETTLTVSLGNCIKGSIILNTNSITYCSLTIPVHSSIRSLRLNSPLYLAGLPPSSSLSSPLSLSTNQIIPFAGCLRNVVTNRKTVDFSNVRHSGNLRPGCRQTSTTGCDNCGGNGNTCVQLWNGSFCHREDQQDDSVLSFNTSSVYSISFEDTLLVQQVSLQLRTHLNKALFLTLGEQATLEVFYGSVVFRYFPTPPTLPVTMTTDAHVSDGYWHNITLTLAPSLTRLSVDEGRVVADSNQTVYMMTDYITFSGPTTLIKEKFIGCLKLFSINSIPVSNFNVSSTDVTSGCHDNDPCSDSSVCPTNSECKPGWRSFTCSCINFFFPDVNSGTCYNPCAGSVCNNRKGTCSFDSGESDGHTCICGAPFLGLNCEINSNLPCDIGLYRESERCQPCLCDTSGTTSDVCNTEGKCYCNPSIPTYSPGSNSNELSCKVCNCHPVGSTSPFCNTTMGRCSCKLGVTGDHCDTCQTGYVQFGADGCKEATLITGSFVIKNLFYFTDDDSTTLRDMITKEVLDQLNGFVLPTSLELSISLYNSSNMTGVNYQLTSYSPNNDNITAHLIASILQTIINKNWIGIYILEENSHWFDGDCSSSLCDPLSTCNDTGTCIQCTDCPPGTDSDGVICRSRLAQNCMNSNDEDTDYDGVPDNCDTCPYWFNPRQDLTSGCVPIEGACPREKYMNVLWSMTNSGERDVRSCPSPLIGVASRGCGLSGQWEEPDYKNCTSFTGQQVKNILQELDMSPPSTYNDTTELINQVFSLLDSSPSLYSADLNTTTRLLTNIINLTTIFPLQKETNLRPLMNIVGLLSSSKYSEEWLKPGSNAGTLLDITDTLSTVGTSSVNVGESLTLQTGTVSVMYARYSSSQYTGLEYSSDSTGSVSIPQGVLPNRGGSSDVLSLSLSTLPDLTLSLPHTTLTNATLGSPVWSISLTLNGTGRVTQLATPINITFPHPPEVSGLSNVVPVCVTWNNTRGLWEESGCTARDNGRNSTVCSCPHLSHFTLVFTPFDPTTPSTSPLSQDVGLLFYIANGLTFCFIIILIVAIIVSTCCASCKGQLSDTTSNCIKSWLQLLVGLLLLYLLFFFVEFPSNYSSSVCSVVGILLEYMSLVIGCLFVTAFIILLFNVREKLTSGWILVGLSIVAWVLPLFYTGISLIVVHMVYSSITDAYGSQLCWITPSLSYLLFVPLCLLFMVSILVLLFLLSLLCCSSTHRQLNTTKWSSLFIISLYLFYLFNYTSTVLTLHSTVWSSVWQFILGGIVIITVILGVLTLPIIIFQTKVKDFIAYKFNLSDSLERKLEPTSNVPLTSYYNTGEQPYPYITADDPSLTDPVYQTIPNDDVRGGGGGGRGEGGIGGEQLYHHPMHCIEATKETNNNGGVLHHQERVESHSRHSSESSYNSSSQSEPDSAVDLETLDRPPSSANNLTTPNYVGGRNSPNNVGGAREWFDDLETNLCSPMTPPTYVESPHLPINGHTIEEEYDEMIVHNEIDILYQQTRSCHPIAPSPSEQVGGDYVELKNNEDPALPTSDPWYDEPETAITNYRKQSQEATPLAPPPPLYSTIPSLEDQFDDHQYATMTNKPHSTPTKRKINGAQSMTQVSAPLPPALISNHSMSKINTSVNSNGYPRRTSLPHHTTPPQTTPTHGIINRRHSSTTSQQSVSKPHPSITSRNSITSTTSNVDSVQLLHHNGGSGVGSVSLV